MHAGMLRGAVEPNQTGSAACSRPSPQSYVRGPLRLSFRASCLAAVLEAILTLPAWPADGQGIVRNGNGHGAPACSACHGQQGQGRPELGYPRLSGLDPEYLVRQLASFADESRINETMKPIAKALTPEERQAVAAFYGTASAPKAEGEKKADEKLLATGAILARRGDWSRGLPGCGQCHGPDGQGVGTAFPKLATQSARYIADQLKAWKQGRRTDDPLHLMTGIASKLGDDEAGAVAAYYAGLTVPPAPINQEETTP